MSLVVDVSIALAWLLPDEANDEADRVLSAIVESGALTPEFFKAECANVLAVSVRRRRLGAKDRQNALAFLSNLNIVYDKEAMTHCWTSVVDLAERYDLTVYDALYLETALRNSLPLATLDNGLKRAAGAHGVALFGHGST